MRDETKFRSSVRVVLFITAWCAASFIALSIVADRSGDAAQLVGQTAKPRVEPRDLFPYRARIRYAKGFTLTYHDTYKEIQVLTPWQNAHVAFTYILVPRELSPPPHVPHGAMVIKVPVRRIALTSTTFVPFFPMLHIEQAVVGISGCKLITIPKVVEMIRQGKIAEIGLGNGGMTRQLNMERLFALHPEVVMVYGTGISGYDLYPKLMEAGFKTVVDAGYMEPTPLGRAEWIKFIAAFFDKEALGERLFDQIAHRYEALAQKVRSVSHRPTVFCGSVFRGLWYIPGGDSWFAKLLADAGADYLWRDNRTRGVLPVSVETVVNRAREADFWLDPGVCRSLQELAATDSRYRVFRAFHSGRVYNNNAKIGPGGGNDFWQTAVTRPDLVLADLISIFHPKLVPSHRRIWYWRLPLHTERHQ